MTNNYGLAIILFTLVLNIAIFPLTVSGRKSMVKNSRLTKKQEDLKKLYPNDNKKYQEELAKLYEREGFNPMTGCLPMFLPLLIQLSIFGTVMSPLSNMLHISAEKISQAVSTLGTVSGAATGNMRYAQIELIRIFPSVQDKMTMFTANEAQQIMDFSKGFNFLGIDLLRTPISGGFLTFMWVIPVINVLIMILSQIIMQKTNQMANPQMQQGCNKFMPYIASLPFIYFTFIAPNALGIYYIFNSIVMIIQNLIINHFYNPGIINAKDEAARILLKEQQEAALTPSYRPIFEEQTPKTKKKKSSNK